MPNKINLFKYDNYRLFLQELYLLKRQKNAAISYRSMGAKIGFKSPGYYQMVVDGKKNLTAKSAQLIAEAFRFSVAETEYLKILVQYTHTVSITEKQALQEHLSTLREKSRIKKIDRQSYKFFSQWFVPALRELVLIPGTPIDPKSLGELLRPAIQSQQAKEALNTLMNLGLIQKNQDGTFASADQAIATDAETAELSVRRFHTDSLINAMRALENEPVEKRTFQSLVVAVNPKSLEKAKKMIHNFLNELNVTLSQEKNPSSVYQINMQMFALSAESSTAETASNSQDE